MPSERTPYKILQKEKGNNWYKIILRCNKKPTLSFYYLKKLVYTSFTPSETELLFAQKPTKKLN